MKTKNLTNQESVMLLFTCDTLYDEYQKPMSAFTSVMASDKASFVEIVFQDPKSLFLDNKVSEPVFMELNDVIINSWNFKDEKLLKFIKWNAKVFFYTEKQADATFYHIIGQQRAIDDFKKVYSFKSWSIKRNLTKKERVFIFKFINGYFKNKYSWNMLYFEELLDDIQRLSKQLKSLDAQIEELSELLDDSIFLGVDISDIQEEYIELLEEKQDIEEKLNRKQSFEDKLLFSISDEDTTLSDYAIWNSEE